MSFFIKKNNKSKYDLLIVGLGNPGPEYENTRHNVGFSAVELISKEYNIPFSKHKFNAHYGFGEIDGKNVILMKPLTYMNLSGEAVRDVSEFYKIPSGKILVISDDIDLPVGKLRIRKKGSAGGHNGLKNIILHLSTEEIMRIKIGVGQKPNKDYDLAKWVLSHFNNEEQKLIAEADKNTADAVGIILNSNIEKAMEKYN